MAVTLKDVAEHARVSRSAVSRVFTDGASVSAKMRRRVEKAAEELGYSPNILARSLTTRRTKLIGLVSNNFHNPIFLEVFDRFTRGLQDRGLRPLLLNLSEENDRTNAVRMMRQYSVDGVVVVSSTLAPDFPLAFRDAGVPVVHSFGRAAQTPLIHVVGIDNVEAGRMAARELVARGIGGWGSSEDPRLQHPPRIAFRGFCRSWSPIRKSSVEVRLRRHTPFLLAGRRCGGCCGRRQPRRISAATTCCRSER